MFVCACVCVCVFNMYVLLHAPSVIRVYVFYIHKADYIMIIFNIIDYYMIYYYVQAVVAMGKLSTLVI